MGTTSFIAILALMTLAGVTIFALWSKERTDRLREDDDAPESTLAADTPDK